MLYLNSAKKFEIYAKTLFFSIFEKFRTFWLNSKNYKYQKYRA